MKKIFFLIVTSLIFSGFMLKAEGEKKEEQVPVVKEVEGFFLGHQEYSGSYATMGKKIPEFVSEFMNQGLMPMGNAVTLYFNSPNEVKEEELKWAFGFVVPKETKVKEPMKIKEFNKHKAILYLHEGPYQNLGKSYEIVWKFIKEKGYTVIWPVYDRYLNNPQMVKPEELKTQIVIPIE